MNFLFDFNDEFNRLFNNVNIPKVDDHTPSQHIIGDTKRTRWSRIC